MFYSIITGGINYSPVKFYDSGSARKSLHWIYNGNESEIEKVMEDIRLYQGQTLENFFRCKPD